MVSVERLKEDGKAFSSPNLGQTKSDKSFGSAQDRYAITRTIKNIVDSGFADLFETEQNEYIRLTPLGRQKLYRDELTNTTAVMNPNWDGTWRIIILDLPEDRKSEREALRYLLKKAGFVCAKNSVWVSPLPFEYFFEGIKKDFGLSTEMLILKTSEVDEATEKMFKEFF
jgi:DNA-binding transcriptional regulator PaaX